MQKFFLHRFNGNVGVISDKPPILKSCMTDSQRYPINRYLNNNEDLGVFLAYARDLKNLGKYGSDLKCRWGLFTS